MGVRGETGQAGNCIQLGLADTRAAKPWYSKLRRGCSSQLVRVKDTLR